MILENYRLIKRIQKGDQEAFDKLVRLHYQNIFSYCFRKTSNEDIAYDLTQDVFLKLIASIQQYQFKGKFTNYLFTIAVNTCRDYEKKMKPLSLEYEDELVDQRVPIEKDLIHQEDKEVLFNYINELPDKQKEVILLYYYHDFKLKEIARILDIPLPTVKSRLKLALIKLKNRYQRGEAND